MYFSIFSEEPGVNAFFSTRLKGVSPAPWESLNFGGNTGDTTERARQNRTLLLDAAELSGAVIVRAQQVHGDHVACVTEEMAAPYREAAANFGLASKDRRRPDGSNELILPDTDALVTNCENVLLTTIHADCLPVYLLDRKHRAAGLAHAGWRGTCAGIGPKTVRTMAERFGAVPEEMTAFVGPGICRECFEVGTEVYEAFAERWDFIDEFASRSKHGKYLLDLAGINRRQLEELGVGRIKVSEHCTFCEPELFYSHRRDQGKTGRMGAGICLIS